MLVWVLLLTGMPLNLVSDDVDEILEDAGLVMNVQAAELSELTAQYTGHSYSFISGESKLSEYSQCFQDATWAADHGNDILILSPSGGKFVFDANYIPIGTAETPFGGTISLTTDADEFAIEAHTPIFDYVKDSVKIVRSKDNVNIALNINRVADAGTTVSPLMAKHVVGSGAAAPYDWMVTLNAASAKSYSGVIYEMAQGAKVNLTFVDNSNHEAKTDANGNISTGSIIDNKQDSANYGILCGAVKDGSVLQAKYTNTNNTEVTFIGTGTAYCGGLIGEINNSTFELLSGSSALKVYFQTAKNHAGFICGHAEGSTITLPDGYTFSGTVFGNQYAGGIAGYCKNTVINFGSTTESTTEGITVNITESTTVGTIESTTQGAIEGTPESITGSVTEGTTGSTSESTTEGTSEGTTEGTSEGTTGSTPESTTEVISESATEGTPENTTGGANESTNGSIVEGTTEGMPGSTPEGTTEIIPNSTPESTSEGTSGPIALNGCTIKNGSSALATGGVFGYYECDKLENDILLNRTYTLSSCTLTSEKGSSGGIVGDYWPKYGDSVTIDLNKYTLSFKESLSGTTAGGLFGKYNANGSVTITDTDNSTHFAAPSSNTAYGGVIGEYENSDYNNTLTLSGFTVDKLTSTSTGSVGGVISTLNGSTYVSVNGVSITNVNADKASYFGGIVSTLDTKNTGSFIDVTGDFTLSMATGKTYKGGAIAGSFKTGVIRLADTTDISGAQAANGYAQLVYENDETLVYAKGSGSDSNWTLKRNVNTTASDLGQWGEVVRQFNGQDAEEAGIVTFSDNKVTIASVPANPSINDAASFAKVALNMQLNDGNNHGALCFAEGGVNKTSLLSSSISVSGTINLAGTGLLGFMRDGGNGKYLQSNSNTFIGNPDFFTGSISGADASNGKILLAVGEAYGCDASGTALSTDATGGRIYLSENWGHDAQGLVSFGKGASFSNITIGGTMHVSRVAGSNHLYMAPVIGAMTNGATLTNVIVDTTMTADRANDAKFYVGGVSGVFDGAETADKPYTLSISGNTIKPIITLTGKVDSDNDYNKNNTYAGGVLGLLKGKAETQYSVSITSSDVSPKIYIDNDVTDNPERSFVGGMIGRVAENKTKERTISINNVTMNDASVETKAKYPGGLLGSFWDRTIVTIDGLTITDSSVSHKYSSTGSKQSGLVFKGSGKWDINSLSIKNSEFISTDTAPASFGLIVNEAYSGDDGLFIDLKNSGYTLEGVTVPVSSSDTNYYVDEIAADTKNNDKDNGDILAGGNGTGIININMNVDNGTNTKITDTGTYQNRLYEQLGNLVANQNSRYYYNLDVMLDNGTKGSTATGGEQFLLWSVRKYAAGNLKDYFKDNDTMISSKDIDLTGLSYYPISGGGVKLPDNAIITFGFDGIKTVESTSSMPDNWARQPDYTDKPNTDNARNQHYLMQTGLFTTTSSLTANKLTLKGDFGYVTNVASGALINGATSGSVNITGLTLDGLKPSSDSSAMLINKIDGAGSNTPMMHITTLDAKNYPQEGTTAIASALINTAVGTGMDIVFKDIKLDARNGSIINDANWNSTAASNMNNAYGTSRSIFKDATFFKSLSVDSGSKVEYNYEWSEDWGASARRVTYAKEITDTIIYKDEDDNTKSGENKYSGSTRNYTNPVDGSNTEFSFSNGFLPHVKEKASDDTNTYPIYEVKVNYLTAGLITGCGTYNDPYIIDSGTLMKKVADYINSNSGMLSEIRLPNQINATWHSDDEGDAIYKQSGTSYSSSEAGAIKGWTDATARKYLAGAYYKVTASFELPAGFESISKGETNETGENIFHGVIVGQKTNGVNPIITNNSGKPFIKISNGAVIKDIDFSVSSGFTLTDNNSTLSKKRFGYGRVSDEAAQYYGGVIGEIMGGDNIIDNVDVVYSNESSITLSGSYGNTIPIGGYVGVIVNGGLFFRNMPDLSEYNKVGLTVKNGSTDLMSDSSNRAIYVNPLVGRVINGYAVNEGSTALNNGTKHYTIDKISKPVSNEDKLSVSVSNATINIPNAQALFVLSLITQSTAGIAESATASYNEKCFSYGMKSTFLAGVTHQGDYSQVGALNEGKIITTAPADGDYELRAKKDTALASSDLRNKAVPYLINNYCDSSDARCVTNEKTYFTVTLTGENTHYDLASNFPSFRGIGCVGNSNALYNMKLKEFNGGGNTVTENIKLSRYGKTKDNYFYGTIKSTDPQSGYSKDMNTNDFTGMDGTKDNNRVSKTSQGIGLFDYVTSKDKTTNRSWFKNMTVKGSVQDLVFDTSDDTCKNGDSNKYPQRFSAGGVLGMAYHGSVVGFNDITLDDLTVNCSFSSGGIAGLIANDTAEDLGVSMNRCQTGNIGVTIIGGYNCKDTTQPRQGTGGLLGMVVKSKTEINQDLEASEKDTLYTVVIRQATNNAPKTGRGNNNLGDSNSGGLIGYGGTGVVANNMKVIGANSDSVIGSEMATANAAGMVAFAQNQSEEGNISSVTLTNCHVEKINIEGNLNAGGLFAKSWEDKWSPSFCHFIDCSVTGEINNSGEPIYKIYGCDTSYSTGGGFIASARASSKSTNSYSNIDKCHITGYKIEAANAGGMAGNVKNKPLYLTNSYIEDCVITSKSVSGGFVSYLENSVLGYNLMTKNVRFTNDNSGQFIGNANSKTVKLVGVAKYADSDQLSSIKTEDIFSNGSSPFIVYGDYNGASKTDINNNTGNASTLESTNNVDQPFAPYITVNPRETLGVDEYITSDGAGIGSVGEIYKDVKGASSNRKYVIGNTVDPSSGTSDLITLTKYIEDNGEYKKGAFKISTAFDEFCDLPSGVQNFAMLVINDDSAKAEDITPFIKSYIRLVTNTPERVAQADYSCGNAEINELYVVNVSPCYYDANVGRFVIGTTGEQGLSYTTGTNYGKYVINSSKADSASSNPYQFSLIDVQFKDPTDTTGTKIAYHLYVPVYTKKIPAVDFSAVSMSETRYYRSNYTNRIYSEINAGKTANNPSQLVESTNEWTTTFIRYTYPKNQIDANADWNFDKSITLTLDANFKTLPIGTKMILVDPNANADKFYTYTINAEYATNTAVPLPLSSFVDESGHPFAPQSLSKIMASAEATSTAEGHTNDLYEDYYISIYVPKQEGYTHSIIVGCGTEMSCTGRDDKANITPKLYSRVVLGDLFTHSVEQSFIVVSGDGTTYSDSAEMTAANHVLKTQVTATVQIKDRNAGNYLAGSDVYHSFFITLTSHDAEQKVSDIIYGINSGNISNTTTYSYTDSAGNHTNTVTASVLGANYIQLNTGNILDALYDSQSAPEVKITSETTMSFYDVTAFPYNLNKAEHIGTQVSVKSSLAYREEDLLYSAMNITQQDPEGKFYYSTTQNSAELSFNAVPTDDVTDEIGLKTNNKSLLGVNGKYGTSHPIIGLAIYNVDDIIDYDSATEVVYKITLHKKVTDENGTRYVKVSDISKYLSDVKLTDDEVELTADKSYPSEYVYKGPINHNQQIDLDKMFDVDFSCNVLTGDANHNEYANYKIQLTAELVGASNSWKDSFIIYTNAKFDPSVIDEL